MAFEKKLIPKKTENISEWYNSVILQAQLADYGPAKGTMIFRPYGYAIWENVQKEMDRLIKARGVENAYFPLFIPESLLQKEKQHVEGFSPELAVVTIGGNEELEERLVVRPTSETIMYHAYARWIQSWRDLPLQINQWNNVVRWEKRTYLFLRTSEFLWQEGHTAHADHNEALQTVLWAIKMYAGIYVDLFAVPGFTGYKSQTEKFAGADQSLSYESLMPDGKALQSCTSHDLGQNFSKAFEIQYQDKEGVLQNVWQTSWGLSTRSIGGMIMTHGDDQGLKLPPRIAPIQVVILPINSDAPVVEYAAKLAEELRSHDIRVHVDDRDYERLGFKINDWELKGVPLRVEIGSKEVEHGIVTIVRRDNGEKMQLPLHTAVQNVPEILDQIQASLYQSALDFMSSNTHDVTDYQDFKEIMLNNRGFIKAFWCEDPACEASIKTETKATTRCLPLESEESYKESSGECIYCGKKATHQWIFAQSY